MGNKKILIIEDETDIVEFVTFNLIRDGFDVISANTGEDGLKKAQAEIPDLILLDIMLPGLNGLDVCRALKNKEQTQHIPIVMLTARNEDVDIITGLEIGAIDYVTKPFSPKVLIARIRAILRHDEENLKNETTRIIFRDITIDQGKHTVYVQDNPIQLTLTEFQILLVLIRRPGWVFSRTQMIDELREGHQVITDRAIDVQIANLRKKLGRCGDYVETVRGIGYRMVEN
ncbi:MAG: response regulator transcription factor [bacterium]